MSDTYDIWSPPMYEEDSGDGLINDIILVHLKTHIDS